MFGIYPIFLFLLIWWVRWVRGSSLKPVKNAITVGKLKLSPIGAGTWSWGNKFLWRYSQDQDDELRKTYDYLLRNGVSWFDTADSYGTGGLAGRRQEAITSNVLASQRRLQCPIDILQLHWPPTFGWQENAYLDSFAEAIEGGIATQVGLSNFGPKGLRVIVEKLRQRNLAPYTNQVQFSMLCRQPLQNGLVEACREWNIQPISYSPLALGLLTDTYSLDNLPKGPRALLFREFLPAMTPLLQELRAIARTRGKTVAQVALNWNLQKGFLVLVGVRSAQQAQDNLGALGWALSSSEIEELDRAAQKVPKSLPQNANQSK